jgi:hypothetical protein
MLDQSQIEQLSTLCFINRIDDHLRIVSGVRIPPDPAYGPNRVLLLLEIFYEDEKVSTMSFNLQDYEYDEIVEVAQNIRTNDFILHEVDQMLSSFGD